MDLSRAPTGRFAPSPTGPLHLGSLRTALAAWLFARSGGGRFVLRIEDIDPDRSRRAFEPVQMAALEALGIDWDGPVLRQSERLVHYAAALAELTARGRVYPCFCTRAQIRAASAETQPEHPEGAYPGTCRHLGAAERDRRIAAGERHSLRFDAAGERVDFVDRLAGPQSFRVDDFVLRRSDGVFAYQLAVVVDDHLQGVDAVVRGADLLDSVARQTLLMRTLGLPEPSWTHVPLVLGPDGRRLAKRHGGGDAHTALLASAPATLAVLGASLGIPTGPGRGPEAPRRAGDLLDGFDPNRIPTGPVTL